MPKATDTETADDGGATPDGRAAPVAGVVVHLEGERPTLRAVLLTDKPLRIGREAPCDLVLADGTASKAHAEIAVTRDGFSVRDLGGRNGTFVDGALVKSDVVSGRPRVVRMGRSVMRLVDDVWPYMEEKVHVRDGYALGIAMRRAYNIIAQAARAGSTCLIIAESGAGKEHAAKHYFATTGRAKLVPINCGAIAVQLAESELFGATKGAYSGAVTDRPGHFGEADRGVIFLDEIGNLPLDLQAKILRAIEAKEILRVGATRALRVDVLVVAATNADLEEAVESGVFRMDLYQRLAQTEVKLPPIRERPEEIPYIVELAVNEVGEVRAHASLYAECMLRAWCGANVRGLRRTVGAAARAVRAAQRPDRYVYAKDLAPRARSDAWPTPSTARQLAPALAAKRDRPRQGFFQGLEQGKDVAEAAEAVGRSRAWGYAVLAEQSPPKR